MVSRMSNQTKTQNQTQAQAQKVIDVESTELATINSTPDVHALVPSSLDGAMQFAKWLAQSSLLPKAVNKEHDIFFIICAGMELGLPPMAALRGLYTVHGRTALESKTKAALCIQKGAAVYFKRVEFTPDATTWETLRRGASEPQRMRYTRQEAIDAFLAPGKPSGGGATVAGKEGPWRQFTQRMISHRALGWLCDDVYPDIVMGVATAEDFDANDTYQPISSAAKAGAIDVPPQASHEAPAATTGPSPVDPPKAKPATSGRPPIYEVEVEDLVAKIGEFTSAKDLRAWATENIQGRECSDAVREKLSKHYEDQLDLIKNAAAEEKKNAAPTPKGDR